MRSLRIHDVKWSTDIAGPGPNGLRTEIFLRGCRRARLGQPCEECFNPTLWKDDVEDKISIDMAVKRILKYAPTRHVTIGGGEPTDQLYSLIDLVHGLKRYDFHIILYTWRSLVEMASYHFGETQHLLGGIDILVDGEYRSDQRIYDSTAKNGVCNWIGSANQTVWDVKSWREHAETSALMGVTAGDIERLYLNDDNDLMLVPLAKASPKKIVLSEFVEDNYG